MQRNSRWLVGPVALSMMLGATGIASAQERPPERPTARPERPILSVPKPAEPGARAPAPVPPSQAYRCAGPVSKVVDLAFEGVKTTTAVFGTSPGGGEGKEYDPIPIFTFTLALKAQTCLNAFLTAAVGGKPTYGFPSPLTFFQVTLTRIATGALPKHMIGHYETPYGIASPGTFIEGEREIEMFSANFFQPVGSGAHAVPAGNYRLDVWWAGAPWFAGPGGAIGTAFVLKLLTH